MKFAAIAIFSLVSGAIAQFSPDRCGPQNGNKVCAQNACCSQYGWVRLLLTRHLQTIN
jgi:hypothetical protein